MEDILNNLSNFNVSGQSNTVHAEHPRFSQFKTKQTKSSQHERRKAVLAARKNARYDLLKHIRHVEQGMALTEDSQDDGMEGVECYKRPRRYKDFIMQSEWLVDVPEDFAATYYAMPCPAGKRCLVVSGSGQTAMYVRNGGRVETFYSVMPGGSMLTIGKGYAIFDCVVSYEDNTFYILDIIAWMNQSVMQCETDFRFEWIKSRLQDNDYNVATVCENNTYRFLPLHYHNCDKESLHNMMTQPFAFGVDLDGILFYHKEGHYTHGQTPLVGWLKPYMMDEILGVPVDDKFLEDKPPLYTNLSQHIQFGKESRDKRLAENDKIKQQKKAERQQKHIAHQKSWKKSPKKTSMDTTPPSCSSSSSGSPTHEGSAMDSDDSPGEADAAVGTASADPPAQAPCS